MTWYAGLQVSHDGSRSYQTLHGALRVPQSQVKVFLALPRGLKDELWTRCAKCGLKAYPPYVVVAIGKRREVKEFRTHPACSDFVKDPRAQALITKAWQAYEHDKAKAAAKAARPVREAVAA